MCCPYGVFNNSGTFRKINSTGQTPFLAPLQFNNVGIVDMQSGTFAFEVGTYSPGPGAIWLRGGNVSGDLQIAGGVITGTGTITGSVYNSGQISPGASPGILTITGSYTQSPTGTLNIEIGGLTPGTQYDRLQVNGSVTLSGTLNISTTNGFIPNIGDAFQVLNYNSRSGSFGTVNGTNLGNGRAYSPAYNSNNMTLNVTDTCTLSPDYILTSSTGASIVPGTSYLPGSTCNSCTVSVTLPFSYSFYGTAYSQVNVSNSGTLQFVSNNASGSNNCLPNAAFNDTIFAYWDSFNTNINDNMGMFTSVSGTAPNRIFNIEWRAGYEANDVRSGFEVRLYEGQPKFEVIYGQTRGGFSATIGVQKGTGERSTTYACNTNGTVQPGRKITFD